MMIAYDGIKIHHFFLMSKRFFAFFVLTALVFSAFIPTSLRAASWPASTSGVDIGTVFVGRSPAFEPSGLVWHQGRGTLIAVGDEGQVAELKPDGTLVNYWELGSSFDLEDVTLADPNGSLVYLADENKSAALEFSLLEGALTGRSWSFSSKLAEVDGAAGMEGLAFVPDGVHPYGTTGLGGAFYAGWQYDGDIYVFAPGEDGSATFLEEIHMTSGYTDLSALNYDFNTQLVYALYDGLNLLEERTPSGTLVNSFSDVPGPNQEGFALVLESSRAATAYVARDSGGILALSGYPVELPVIEPAPEPEPEPTPVSPIEFADNGIDDDGDGIIDEVNTLSENGLHPTYGTYDPADTTAFGTSIVSARGVTNGKIDVRYADASVYEYDVFSKTTSRLTDALSYKGSAYLLVTLAKNVAMVNGFTGEVIATRSKPKSQKVLMNWAKTTLGF